MTSTLANRYKHRYQNMLCPIAAGLLDHLREVFDATERIDQISARAKGIDRFLAKAEATGNDGQPKYTDPLTQIQDQIGARVVTFYLSDVERLDQEVTRHFRFIENLHVVPDSESEFGYFGKHYVLFIPQDVVPPDLDEAERPEFFELQVKTLYQHAWSEANHDIGYKPNTDLTADQKRKIAFTSAQSWGADKIFEELFRA